MPSCLVATHGGAIWQFGIFCKLPRNFLKMVGAAAGRKLGWLMPFVAIGWSGCGPMALWAVPANARLGAKAGGGQHCSWLSLETRTFLVFSRKFPCSSGPTQMGPGPTKCLLGPRPSLGHTCMASTQHNGLAIGRTWLHWQLV